MVNNQLGIQTNNNSDSVRVTARLLMSISRHKQQNREQTMLHRTAEEIGINE
ncbi:hypothetical protein [Gloeothece verrucosa]|uniref:Uncharacterized protein n=1 Tax=Gloeothece verrucosa (strain PCC 7822) TaxID=497965 RepID=E0UCQ8_GLOV7|nr:hypothetical protein [Gloeothece verrucosa]ADN15252.1 hypothetical protein Cyan7822_3302 [Gloeothece verrucosa PCC 7822]